MSEAKFRDYHPKWWQVFLGWVYILGFIPSFIFLWNHGAVRMNTWGDVAMAIPVVLFMALAWPFTMFVALLMYLSTIPV